MKKLHKILKIHRRYYISRKVVSDMNYKRLSSLLGKRYEKSSNGQFLKLSIAILKLKISIIECFIKDVK